MARFFTEANSEIFQDTTSSVITAYPFTMACWGRDNDGSDNDRNLMELGSGDSVTFHRLSRDTVGNNVAVITKNGGSSSSLIPTTTAYTTNEWAHFAGVFESGDVTAYLNGGGAGTTTHTVTIGTVDTYTIGGEANGPADFWDGDIAHCAIWDVALTAEELVSLANGAPPWTIRPASLVSYLPMAGSTGNEIDLISGDTLVETGTIDASEGPPIAHPSWMRVTFEPAAGTNITVPVGSGTITGAIPTATTTQSHVIEVPTGSLSISGETPTTGGSVAIPVPLGTTVLSGEIPTIVWTDNHVRAPPAGSLSLTGAIPTVQDSSGPQTVQPGTGSLTATGYAPPSVLQPSDYGLQLVGYAPTVNSGADAVPLPGAGSLALTGFIPTLSVTQIVAPGTGALTVTGDSPALEVVITNADSSLFFTGHVPTVAVTDHISIDVPAGSLSLTGLQPIVLTPIGTLGVQPLSGALSLTGHEPTVYLSKYFPDADSLSLTGFAPTVDITQTVRPGTGTLAITGSASTTTLLNINTVLKMHTLEFLSVSYRVTLESDAPREYILTESGVMVLIESGSPLEVE